MSMSPALMHSIKELLNWFFPPSKAGRVLARHEKIPIVAWYTPLTKYKTLTLSSYQSPFIASAIKAGKYEHNQSGLNRLGALLAHHCIVSQIDMARTLFVPIPIHAKRKRERGYNQTDIILKAAQHQLPTLQYQPLLRRTVHRETQSHFGKQKRAEQIYGVFATTTFTIPPQITTVVIIDDVITTGSTLREATKTLTSSLPKNILLETWAIARAE